jgi:hypothetical protein
VFGIELWRLTGSLQAGTVRSAAGVRNSGSRGSSDLAWRQWGLPDLRSDGGAGQVGTKPANEILSCSAGDRFFEMMQVVGLRKRAAGTVASQRPAVPIGHVQHMPRDLCQ